jgi:hypothetical protein
MAKTKHNRSMRKKHNKSVHRKNKERCCCEHTFCGLGHWHKAMFEKLGWMVLAKKMGYTDKIETYRNSIRRLQEAIEHKLKHHTHDYDRKEDLKIMCGQVCELQDHVNIVFV